MVDLVSEIPLTVAKAAELMDVHRRTIEAWFAIGLERCKAGRRVYTTRQALQRFVKHFPQASACETAVDDRPLRQRRRDARAATKEVERRWGLARTRKKETITNGREAGQS